MFRWPGSLVAASALLCSCASAQETEGLAAVWFIHSDCAEAQAGEPGSSRETAIDVEFDELWYAVEKDEYEYVEEEEASAASQFECRWVRTSGFLSWTDYYDYLVDLRPDALSAYWGGDRFIVESFAEGSKRRGDLAQRQVMLVGRFYDLCAAADQAEQSAGKTWWLFGPCHYGANNGMMLADVSVEEVHDAAPQYLLGEANRTIFRSLMVVEGDGRASMTQAVRDWAAAVRGGPAAFADELVARASPPLSPGQAQETRDFVANPHSYVSYLHAEPRFGRIDLSAATVEVFQEPADLGGADTAVGCVCLERSCEDRWPLAEFDARNFLGDAACVRLRRNAEDPGAWRW